MSTGLMIVGKIAPDGESADGLDPIAVRRCFERMPSIGRWRDGRDLPHPNKLIFECRFSCGDQWALIAAHGDPVFFLSIDRSSDCCLLAALEIQRHYEGELFVVIGDSPSSATSLKSVATVEELRVRLDA